MPPIVVRLVLRDGQQVIDMPFAPAAKHAKAIRDLGEITEGESLDFIVDHEQHRPTVETLMSIRDFFLQFAEKSSSAFPRPLEAPVETYLSDWEREWLRTLTNERDPRDNVPLLRVMCAAQLMDAAAVAELCGAWIASEIVKICATYRRPFDAGKQVRLLLHYPDDWTEDEKLQIINETDGWGDVD